MTKTDWTKEEVSVAAEFEANPIVKKMLTAYAERIEADESARSGVTRLLIDTLCNAALGHDNYGTDTQDRVRSALLAVWPNPPAQAAQVDEPAEGHSIRVLSCDGECETEARWEHQENAYVTQDAIRQGVLKPTLSEFVRMHDAERSVIGRKVAERVDDLQSAAAGLLSSEGDWTVIDCPHCRRCIKYSSKKAASSREAYRDLCAEVDALRAALAAQGHGEAVAWRIDTDDDVERVAKAAGWNNRSYMTPADYAIWCSRMREFVRVAVDSPAPPASPAGVPDGWTVKLSQLHDGYCVDSATTSTLVERGNNLYAFFRDLLAAAPFATPEGGEVGL